MPQINYEKIFIQRDSSKSSCQVFDLDFPHSDKDTELNAKPLGKILGLIEIELPPGRKTASFINSLIQEIKLIKLPPSLADQKPAESIFENLIQRINYKFIELLGSKVNAPFSPDERLVTAQNTNILLVFITEKDLYLAGRGKVHPFLIYRTNQENYKIINILESASGRETKPSNINLFTNIISGKISSDDYLFLSTESLLDYFSLEKLCKIISASEPQKSSDSLKQLLGEVSNQQTSFAALVLKMQPEEIKTIPQIEVQREIFTPQRSMAELLATAANTEKLLNPSLRLNLGEKISSGLVRIKNLFKKEKTAANKDKLEYYASQFAAPPQTKILKFFYLLFLLFFRALYFLIKKFFTLLFGFLKFLVYVIANKNNLRRKTILESINQLKQNINNFKIKFSQLARPSKILLISFVGFAALFLISTVTLYYKYNAEKISLSAEQTIETIQAKKSSIEASIIYNDEEGAKKLLEEAEVLLSSLPQKSRNDKTTYENLKKEINLLREKLRRTINIENLIAIVDFANQNTSTQVNEFLISNNNLYAFDRAATVIYKINLETKEITHKNAAGLNLKFGILKDKNTALFYQPERKIFEFDFKNDIWRQIEAIFSENETNIIDLALYNQRLYTLEVEQGQIFKHSPTIVGFTRGTPWLMEDLNLQEATSFAVDGSIYLTKSNGEILKLANGKRVEFNTSIDPPLQSPTKIWTTPDSSYLYILEPTDKRLVVLDKQGKLKQQYFSKQFNDLKDFVVLEKEKKIYLLDGTKIYAVLATHLQ